LQERESRDRKVELDRMAAVLSCLGKRGYSFEEEPSNYAIDPDYDPDEMKSEPAAIFNADQPCC